jgi:histone H3/H4
MGSFPTRSSAAARTGQAPRFRSAIDEAVKATENTSRASRESQALAVADKRKTVMDHDITKARAKIESGGL